MENMIRLKKEVARESRSRKRKSAVARESRSRKRKSAAGAMDNIPTEIWTLILACLPVKSLLRFRGVSRIWKSIIEEPCFASLHLQSCLNNVLENSLLVKQPRVNPKYFSNCGYKERKWVVRCSETFKERSTQIKFPVDESESRYSLIKIWESVSARDGLLLLQRYPGVWKSGDVKLWNPSIRKTVDIDPPSRTRLPSWYYDHGLCTHYEAFLGFDPSSNDYKVVSFVTHIPGDQVGNLYYAISPYFYVYSLKDRMWEEVSCNVAAGKYMSGYEYKKYSSREDCIFEHKVSVGEYIHWIEKERVGDDDSDQVCLVSLNLTTLTISFTPLSDDIWYLRSRFVRGSSFLGLLVQGLHKSCVIWSKMKNELDSEYYHIRKDGRILVLTKEPALFMCDYTSGYKKEIIVSYFENVNYSYYINSHIESLVLLDR